MSSPSITATYTSPTANQLFTAPLPTSPPSTTIASRTTHLAAQQSSIRTLQTDINAFLTQKMADDKSIAEEDAKAEETYGEELPDVD